MPPTLAYTRICTRLLNLDAASAPTCSLLTRRARHITLRPTARERDCAYDLYLILLFIPQFLPHSSFALNFVSFVRWSPHTSSSFDLLLIIHNESTLSGLCPLQFHFYWYHVDILDMRRREIVVRNGRVKGWIAMRRMAGRNSQIVEMGVWSMLIW